MARAEDRRLVGDRRPGAAGVRIRPIRPADDERVASIIRTVMTDFGAVGDDYSIADPEVDAMTAAYTGPRAAYFVAVVDGEVVGGAGVGPLVDGPEDVCELRKMYLLPGGRGRGLGRGLLVRSLDAAREAGYRRCYIETLTKMTAARGLYENCGFRPLEAPMGATGHTGCNNWYLRDL